MRRDDVTSLSNKSPGMATGEGDLAIVDALERLRLEQQETNNVLRQMLYPVQLISRCEKTTSL